MTARREPPPTVVPAPAHPPVKRPMQLAISSALLAAWMVFLAWMAWG